MKALKKIINLPENTYSAVPSFSGNYIYLCNNNIWIYSLECEKVVNKIPKTRYCSITVDDYSARWGYLSWKANTIECGIYEDEMACNERYHLSLRVKDNRNTKIFFSPTDKRFCWVQTYHALYSWNLEDNSVKPLYQTNGWIRSVAVLHGRIAFLECFGISHHDNLVIYNINTNKFMQFPIESLFDGKCGLDEIIASWLIVLPNDDLILGCEHNRCYMDLLRMQVTSECFCHSLIHQYSYILREPTISRSGKKMLMHATSMDNNDLPIQYLDFASSISSYIVTIDIDTYELRILQRSKTGSYYSEYFLPDEETIVLSGFQHNGVYSEK